MARFDFIAVYILANRKDGTIYTGVTSDLPTRIDQHKSGGGSSFTGRYNTHILVWYERFEEMAPAIARERRIKSWPRKWKIALIDEINPEWEELLIH